MRRMGDKETYEKNRVEMYLRLIRHGQTASNEAHRYIGTTDEGLSETGILRLRNVLGWEPDLLFAGPMRRCLETATVLYEGREPIIIPEWTEIDFGDFEGHTYEALAGNADYQAWIASDARMAFPHGESREQFIARSMQGYARMLHYVREWKHQRMAEEAAQETDAAGMPGSRLQVAAVVHGGTIMAVCSSLFGGAYFDYQIACGGVWECPVVLV